MHEEAERREAKCNSHTRDYHCQGCIHEEPNNSCKICLMTDRWAWHHVAALQDSKQSSQKAHLQDLLDDKLAQDGSFQQLLQVEAELAEDADSKQAEDCAGGPKGVADIMGHRVV